MCFAYNGVVDCGMDLEPLFERLNIYMPIIFLIMLALGALIGIAVLIDRWRAMRVYSLVEVEADKVKECLVAAVDYGELLHAQLKLKFDEVVITESHIYYKVAVARKTWLGSNRSLLPFGVFVSDLTSKETCKELSAQLNRPVAAHHNGRSLWYGVHYDYELKEKYRPYLDKTPA